MASRQVNHTLKHGRGADVGKHHPTGTATNIKVKQSLGLGLDKKAVEAVQKWKFKPGEKDGKPVTVAATIEVNFRR